MTTEYKSKTGAHPLWQIGIKMLQRIMRKHHETVATVLQTLIDKIVAGGLSISQYTGKVSMELQLIDFLQAEFIFRKNFNFFLYYILIIKNNIVQYKNSGLNGLTYSH